MKLGIIRNKVRPELAIRNSNLSIFATIFATISTARFTPGGGPQYLASARDSPDVAEWMVALTRINMQRFYEQVWGWDDVAKLDELCHKDSRFFLVESRGFVHFRIEVDEDGNSPVVYVYELQVEMKHRGRKLGHALMRAVEDFGLAHGISKIMLTVFTANAGARRFYERLGYDTDPSSPDGAGYVILSRTDGKI